MKTYIVLIALIALSTAVTAPMKMDGYLLTPAPNKTAQIDAFVDMLCVMCHRFEPEFRKFLDTYQVNGLPVTNFLEVKFHLVPLPYHHNAFLFSRLIPFVDDANSDQVSAVDVIHWGISVQDRYQESGALNKSEVEVLKAICTDYTNEIGKSLHTYDECMDAVTSRDYEIKARRSLGFGLYNGVNGTPTILLNGVAVDAPYNATEWPEFIKDYLPEH